ncbi:MAG: hypothetical protein NC453_12205 [Muribaculum sp.]|nr:hypothetical protein [Muribaculum sp.]
MNVKAFYMSIPLLVSNTERILVDSRMAFALTPTGKSLGEYLQWWKEHPVESHDYDGNPLVNVNGNWFSGSGHNICFSIDSTGNRNKVSVHHWKKSWRTLQDIREQWKNATPPDDVYSLDKVIEILSTTEDNGLDRYINNLRHELETANETIDSQRYCIESYMNQTEILRILRIEDMAKLRKDELRVDFEKLDTVLKEYNRANTSYHTEKKRMRRAYHNGEQHTEDSENILQEMKERRDMLQKQVKEIEKTMTERYNPSVMYILPMSIGELRRAYKEATRQTI